MHKTLVILTLAISLSACNENEGELKPFTSDGCSAFPDGTLSERKLWRSCCVEHDFDYWIGGTEEEREASDHRLKACVESVGEPVVASMMLAGVRAGGTPHSPAEFRWGYGWPTGRGYKSLTDDEREQLAELIDDARALVEAEKQRDE